MSWQFGCAPPSTKKKPTNLIEEVASIAGDSTIAAYAKRVGLDCVNVTWEDTGRSFGSSGGSNITDLTLTVKPDEGDAEFINMPVFRKPNFSDVTADMPLGNFFFTVGNESKQVGSDGKRATTRIKAEEYIENIAKYTGNHKLENLLLPRDKKGVLVSAQTVVLPLNKGKVVFNPRAFPYSDKQDDPAVMLICSTAAGTSTQVTDGGYPGQKLYFNVGGRAADFYAERLEDDRIARGETDLKAPMKLEEKERNVFTIWQIPLLQTPNPRAYNLKGAFFASFGSPYSSFGSASLSLNSMEDDDDAPVKKRSLERSSDRDRDRDRDRGGKKRGMDHAMLGVTEPHSDFKGTKNLPLKRNPELPIRVTIMKYRVTDTKVVDAETITEIGESIDSIYKKGIAIGSLVTGSTGLSPSAPGSASEETAPHRVTAQDKSLSLPSDADRAAHPMAFD